MVMDLKPEVLEARGQVDHSDTKVRCPLAVFVGAEGQAPPYFLDMQVVGPIPKCHGEKG